MNIASWCDACADVGGCEGHFQCSCPSVPEGHELTGAKELTSFGWREEIRPDKNQKAIYDRYDQFIYVKDLPEPLRSMRMADLRKHLEAARHNGCKFAVVFQNRSGTLDILRVSLGGYVPTNDLALREVYNLSLDLNLQLNERRSMHLEGYISHLFEV